MSRAAPRDTHDDLGELNIRHLSRELGIVREKGNETHRILLEQVVPALSAIADRLGAVEWAPVAEVAKPPRIPWRLFATAVAASITAAGLVLAGLLILGAP